MPADRGNGGCGGDGETTLPNLPVLTGFDGGACQFGRFGRAWRAWRDWRRTRPFWGGLLVIAGGAEILSTSVVSLGVALRAGLGGLGGFPGTVVALVLALSGVLLWFHPQQRVFCSIVAVVLAIATFNTINYGGFLAGMLLGIVGGALAFAWVPGPDRPPARRDRTWGQGRTWGRRDRQPPPGQPPRGGGPPTGTPLTGGPRGSRSRTRLRPTHGNPGAGHLLSIAAVPLIAAAALPTGPAAGPSAMAPRRTQGCILFIICASPTPPPSPRAGGPAPAPAPGPVLGPSPAPTAAPGGPRRPARAPEAHGERGRATAGQGLVAAAAPSVLTAGSARLVGLAYDGVADMPRASGPPLPMMKFTLSSATLTGRPTLTIHEKGRAAVTTTSVLSFSGHVVLYATKLSGDLLGVPVTVTASSPLSLVLKLLKPLTDHATVTMTQVATDQPLATSASSEWGTFLISVH